MTKTASKLLDQIGSTVKDNPKTLAAILAGGGLAGVAGGLASSGKKDPSESRKSRRMRILRNALLSGAAGAGAVGLGSLAYGNLAHALPDGDVDPATGLFESGLGRGVMGAGLGMIGHNAGHFGRERAAAGVLNEAGITGVNKGDARESLMSFLRGKGGGAPISPYRSMLTAKKDVLDKGLIGAGIDGEAFGVPSAPYRFSDRLPAPLRDVYQNATKAVGDKISPEMAAKLEPVQGLRQRMSRAAFRQPGTAAMIGAGLMAPEVLSSAASLAGPVTPNIFHR